jgi:hypothetical protein
MVVQSPPFPIDFLYLYCSPLSNSKKEEHLPKSGELKLLNNLTDDFKYSLRSICKNAPWFRYIYVVIADDDELPHNIRSNNDSRLRIVRHSEIIPMEFLPTFNSNVIESYVHQIRDLSECFVYLNDDMYVTRPVTWKHFFTKRGKSINRHWFGPLTHNVEKKSKVMYVKMMQNAIKRHGMSYSRFQHQAFPYIKSIMDKYGKRFKAEVLETSTHRYRHPKDFNLLRFSGCFAATEGLAGKILHTLENYDMFLESNEVVKMRQLQSGKIKRPTFLCINNTGPDHKHVYDLLDSWFSDACCFETRRDS